METIGSPALWTGFTLFVLAMLALDLGVFHRKAHAVGFKEALGWSVIWVVLALAFGVGVWHVYGEQRGLEYLTGYLIEKALSVDNIFVFVVLFSAILGLRAMYFLLADVVTRFQNLKVGLALVLVFVGAKMLVADVYKVPVVVSLLVVATLIFGSILVSLAATAKRATAQRAPSAKE